MTELLNNFRSDSNNLIAIESADKSVSYSDLLSDVMNLSKNIASQFTQSNIIAIIHFNPIVIIKLYLAILNSGNTVVIINHKLSKNEILWQLDSIGCNSVISGNEYLHYFSQLHFNLLSIDTFSHLSKISNSQNSKQKNAKLDNIDTIIFTSGSSGRSKAVAHTIKAHLASAISAIAHLNLAQSDKWLLNLPLYHVGGLAIVHRCILAGATIVIANDFGNPFPEFLNKSITHASMVPTQLLRMINSIEQSSYTDKEIMLSSIKSILIGGAACSDSIKIKAKSMGLPVFYSYGSSEMASLISLTSLNSELSSSGAILPHAEFKISDQGELIVRGKSMFSGYFSKSEDGYYQLITNLDADNYFHTKDIAIVNSDNEIVIKGRIDNMFISGGENIYPEEIERAISEFPGIESAIVVPVSDEEFGERPIAFIKSELSGELPICELTQFLQTRIAKFKIPIVFLEFPKEYTQTGIKINRQALKEIAINSYSLE